MRQQREVQHPLLAALTTLGFLISPLMPLSLAPLPAALAEERDSVAVLALRATGTHKYLNGGFMDFMLGAGYAF